IHYGAIGSSDQLVRDELWRNELARRYYIRAVEMEASGIAAGATLRGASWFVVRGIADYCDLQKNNRWHAYASFVAAAYMRALLGAGPNLSRPAGSGPDIRLPAAADQRPDRVPLNGLQAMVDTFQTIPLFREDLQRHAFVAQLPDEIRTAVN